MKTKKQIAAILVIMAIFALARESAFAAASANLNQARNGTALAPTNPMSWVNGNLNTGNAHYIEGMSAPYQCIMTELPIGTQISITFGYDIKNSSKNAFDYLTHYNRITPHGFGVHSSPEGINPLTGTLLPANTPFMTYPIPAPSSAGSTVPGQPGTSFNSIPSDERVMTIYNGTIDTLYYAVNGNLSASASETQIVIVFRAAAATAVLVWGGHIGSRNDWGYTAGVPNSAGGISGSPFHMRLIGWSLGSLGNTDRSISGSIVGAPPFPLPVEVVYFDIHPEGMSNKLEWATATELNNDYFTVERSTGLTNFEALAQIEGAGNSSTLRNYSWHDLQPLSGISYYRLVQTDFDGAKKIFGPVSVHSGKKHEPLSDFKVYSNITSDDFFISYSTSMNEPVQMQIMAISGQIVQTSMLNAGEGVHFEEINCAGIASRGIYFVRLSQGDRISETQKLVKN